MCVCGERKRERVSERERKSERGRERESGRERERRETRKEWKVAIFIKRCEWKTETAEGSEGDEGMRKEKKRPQFSQAIKFIVPIRGSTFGRFLLIPAT